MEKPILFNTEMVRAILDGRKTVTRRVIKPQPEPDVWNHDDREIYGTVRFSYKNRDPGGTPYMFNAYRKPPYTKSDVLYVRETWKQAMVDRAGGGYALEDVYLYKADMPEDTTGMLVEGCWHPSIHMPRAAARIFLRVTGVWVERLQAISDRDAEKEGAGDPYDYQNPEWYESRAELADSYAKAGFAGLWNSTIKPRDLPLYGWDANPWVWVIEFERLEGYKPNESNP